VTQSTALARLAAACGIATDYQDIWGKHHATSPDTQRALLAAMHLPLDGDLDALAEEIETRDWCRLLPPVRVVRIGAVPPHVSVSIAENDVQQGWRWILTLENGERAEGEFCPGDLKQIAERRCGGRLFIRYALPLPAVQVTGYHRLELLPASHEDTRPEPMTLIAAPPACYQPDLVRGEGRAWGLALQLYGVRSRRNWGMGDFSDLRALTDLGADSGAGIIGVNPLHALFPGNPQHCSPYSPSSRLFLNVLYIDVEAVTDCRESQTVQEVIGAPHFRTRLRRLRESEMVEYREVTAVKMEVLELAYLHFRECHLNRDTERGRTFSRFRAVQGEQLDRHALFEALQAHFHKQDASIWGWPVWPAKFRDPASPAVKKFAAENTVRIEFYVYLQWLADQQLAAVGRRALQRGLGVGLYQDLALGVDPGGAEAWANQDVYAVAAHAGAPPDEFNLSGQDWGLPPFIPQRLRETAYAPFIATLRANMRHCGALRIDHVMCLMRLYWVPAGAPATAGAYVSYPLDDLLGILALESQRNHCMVIGEDLGTVPDGLRPALAELGVLSYHPLFFERSDDGSFKPPTEYTRQALVAVSTHDLPTLHGFWKGSDLDTRATLGLLPTQEIRENAMVARAQDRARLLLALQRASLLPEGISEHSVAVPDITPQLAVAVHTFLARTPAQIMVIQPEDVFGVIEQVNLPGSSGEYPNWQRKLPLDIEEWRADERLRALEEAMYRERGSSITPCPETNGCAATIPRATYRLQFNRDFTFSQATELLPYLAELGVSHCYASPYLQARPDSSHGYDIVDHNAINPEIGTMEELERFVQTLRQHDMGHILDMVPNHMGVMGSDNAWWLDVLENGQTSAYAAYFDIDWLPLNPELHGKVLLPLLGDHYGTVLSNGELKLVFDAALGEFSLFYYQHRLPLDPASYPRIIGHRLESLAAAPDADDPNYLQLQSLLTAFGHLPSNSDDDAQKMAERNRDKELHKRQLAILCTAAPDILSHIESNVAEFNGDPADSVSFELLHELIKVQTFRLAYWRVASDEINYRRFFDINDLAALRMENPQVFEDTHRLVLKLVQQGKVDGLRIDHPDGLYDPGQYFRHLQSRAHGRGNGADTIDGQTAEPHRPLYLVIEKILAEHERLPDDWPIHGATGYRFANLANALFIDPGSEKRMTRIYSDFIGEKINFEELVYQSKKLIIRSALAGELNVLSNRLSRIAAASRYTCDFTLNSLRATLAEVVACFPVYRTYLANGNISADDRRHIEWAVAVAKRRSPAADVSIFDFVQAMLTAEIIEGKNQDYRDQVWSFAMRLQQYTAPVMAKGLEDTSFYRYHRLVSLNDVGGEPNRFGITLSAFHAATRQRLERWPHNMLATSTHDSKRSEDVRARINVLSEIPDAWEKSLRRWSRINRSKRILCDGDMAPTRNDEYLLYQTLLGTWPLYAPDDVQLAEYCARIQTYMVKAVRESKQHSSWIKVNSEYENALTNFIQALLAPGEKNLFLTDFASVAQRISRFGMFNSLSQTLLKLTAPGVPDIYQGCELWQFNLVDPDNRRPVDYGVRRQILAGLQASFSGAAATWPKRLRPLLDNMEDGRIKLYLSWRALQLRRRWPELFRDGEYLPLNVTGARADHVCAYARRLQDQTVIVVAPRFFARLSETAIDSDSWQDTCIELETSYEQEWYDMLSGKRLSVINNKGVSCLPLNRLLSHFPVALLANAPE